MTSYPSLKRGFAAGLTLLVLGFAVFFMSRQGSSPSSSEGSTLRAQGDKTGALEWTMYGGTPARNMVNATVKGLPVQWVDKQGDIIAAKIKWSADLGSKAYGGPIVAGGRVFVGTNNQQPRDKKWIKDGDPIDLGVVMCFDEATGKFNWQNVYQKLAAGRVLDWPLEGLCSSPYVEGDRMYYTSNRCELVCAHVADGKHLWKLDMIKDLGVFPHNLSNCSPLVIGDNVYLITSNGVDEDHINVPAPKAPSFIKVDKKSGKALWQDNSPTGKLLVINKGNLEQKDFFKRLVNRGDLIQHGQWSNPSYAVVNGDPQVIFPGGDGWIYAFTPQGKLIWRFDCNPKDSEYELAGRGTRSDFIATPVIYKNRVYIGTGQDPEHETGVGHLWCIDMTKKGDVSPEIVTDNKVFPPKTKKNPDSAMVWHYGGVIANAAERNKLRRNNYFGRTMSTCAIHDDIVYISELSGLMHCLDANTGKVHWEFDTRAPIWSSPYYADGKVYLGTDENTVFVFEHGKQRKILAQNEMDGRVRATPVAANGVLYVMTENKLYAISEKK